MESMIFWDEKRPITTEILRRLSLKKVARELGKLEQYQRWIKTQSPSGKLELGIAEKRSNFSQPSTTQSSALRGNKGA